MADFIRFGDALSSGGKVIGASTTMRYGGKFVARKGDKVTCRQHNAEHNVIIEGDESMTDNGVPIARHGHRAICGCTLISSLA